MKLGDFLGTIGRDYDRRAGMDTTPQKMLRSASDLLSEHCPSGILIRGSGGQATPTFTPWVAFLDPDDTDTPQRGIYVVYLFHAAMESVALSLNQGVTEPTNRLGPAQGRARLRQEADAIRAELAAKDRSGLSSTLSLGASGALQAAYEQANILTKVYPTANLPSEDELTSDLARILSTYGKAIAVKRHLLQSRPGVISTASVADQGPDLPNNPLQDFKPKSHAYYQTSMKAWTIVKSRRHERLIEDYGRWVASRGFSPSTKEHPKDLVIRRPSEEWLTEAKVVYRGNATEAVRAAIGQLLTYRHMLPGRTTGMLALFSESIGTAYVDLIETLGIASVWWQGGRWRGSPQASKARLADK